MTPPAGDDLALLRAAYRLPTTASWTPRAGGHINRSWIVPRGDLTLLIQRLNPVVFPDGGAVVRNLERISAHLQRAALRIGLTDPVRQVLQLVAAADDAPGVQAADGAWWRAVRFIPDAAPADATPDLGQVREVGRAFGEFHRMVADFPAPPLEEVLPGFHDAGARLEALEAALPQADPARLAESRREVEFALERAAHGRVLPPLLTGGMLPGRVVHNDAKSSNVLLDVRGGERLAVVDLDTVMPGTLLYDTGDLIRSLAATAAEDEPDPARVQVEPERVLAVLFAFLAAGGEAIGPAERALLIFSGILLSWEQGVRFLTDHLQGDRYYRIARPGQNLERCRVQFALVRQLESCRGALEAALLTSGG